MWQMAGYFDESDDFERGYAVAGFLGHQHDCVHLDLAWRERILKKHQLDYFKASELNGGVAQFAKYRDDPKSLDAKFSEKEKQFFNQVKIDTIDVTVSFEMLIGIGAVLVLPDYYRLKEEYEKMGKLLLAPYHFCAQTVIL
jgi:hypothetical protein